MAGVSLPVEQAENFRARLRWVLVQSFGNNKAAMGRALGKASGRAAITGQALTQSLNATNGPGWPMVRGLAAHLRVKVDDVLAPFAEPSAKGPIVILIERESAALVVRALRLMADQIEVSNG